jgi:hypothetical protein
MKRLTLLLLGLALGVASTASAQGLTMQMSNGWSFSFSGNVNAFWVFAHQDSSALGPSTSYSQVRTGLLPAFATFEARGKEAGMNLAVHFGFAPQVNTGGAHDHFGPDAAGAQIDMRQVYLTVGGDWGQILAGRELGLYQRQNILNDMTLFGVGAVGALGGRGTTLGRIGYGYIYPNFVAQFTYSTLAKNPAQLSIGVFEPSTNGAFGVNKIPRVEAEVTWHQASGKNKYMLWAGGEWQNNWNALDSSVSSVGGTAGIKFEMQELAIVVSGYLASGVGNGLQFVGDGLANATNKRKSDGGYVQLTYTANRKTTLGASWGFSRLKGAGATSADGTDGPIGQVQSYTVGIYHQWTKSLKLVFEGTREINSHFGAEALPAAVGAVANRTDISGGFMLFY